MGRDQGVTVVTAAWRAENLDRVAECLRLQTRRPDEWIVVNDNQDGVRDWNEANRGACLFIDLGRRFGRYGLYSRNVGAMCASMGQILFLDDDNAWPENFIETMCSTARATGKIPYADMLLIGKKNDSYRRVKKSQFAKQNIDLGCLLYSKDLFLKYGYFRDDKRFHTCFDWDLISRIYEGEGQDRFVRADTQLVFSHKLH